MKQRTIMKTAAVFLLVVSVGLSALLVTALTRGNSPVTMEQASSIAATAGNGVAGEVEEETQNGRQVYSVEVKGDEEREVTIDKETGEVTRVENEGFVSSEGAKINAERAKEIAVAETGGFVTDIDTDRIAGRDAWEVEITKGSEQADVLVDMQTGEVLTVEWESEEEDD